MFKFILGATLLFSLHSQAQLIKAYVTLNPAGDFVAETSKISGQAVEKADGSIMANNIKVDVKSLKSGISLRDEHMNNKYLDAAKHPEIILKMAKGSSGKGQAILEIKGKQGKVSGTYMKGKDKIKASFNLKLSEFGIGDISYKGIGVEDEVKIEVTVPLVKETAASAKAKVPAANSKK